MTNLTARKQILADALLLVVTLIWGSTFVMVKDAVAAYPVFPFLALRFWLAAGLLLILSLHRLRHLGWRGWGAGALIGLFLFAGYAFQTLGLARTSASKAGFITGLSVVLVPLFAALFLRERVRLGAVAGVALATVGLALLSLNDTLHLGAGDLLVLACAVGFALHIVAVGAFGPGADPLALTFVQVLTVAIAASIASLITGGWRAIPTQGAWLAAIFTGILATAVAFGVQNAVQRLTTSTHTALIFSAEPVFAAVFGVLLAGDVLTARIGAGGALILVGMVASELSWSQRMAAWISRFLGPQYVISILLVVLGLADPESRARGLLWAVAIGLPVVGSFLLMMTRELRRGKISDWHISQRHERLQPVPIILSLLATALPLAILAYFRGPRWLLAMSLAGFCLVLVNLVITLRWKISHHVSSIALAGTLATAALGIIAAPLMLLVPLVAWARVRVGAHTVWQTIAGGAVGIVITFGALRFLGLA